MILSLSDSCVQRILLAVGGLECAAVLLFCRLAKVAQWLCCSATEQEVTC